MIGPSKVQRIPIGREILKTFGKFMFEIRTELDIIFNDQYCREFVM